jgi:hypothetical protein
METIPKKRIQESQFQLLFITIINLIADAVDHDGTFWGIRFPIGAPSFDRSIVYIIKKHLEGSGHPVLEASLERLYLAVVLPAVVVKTDRESIEHTIGFIL